MCDEIAKRMLAQLATFVYTSFIHRTTAIEKIHEHEMQLNKRTNNTKAHELIKH